MAENKQTPEADDSASDLRNKLTTRLAVAGGLVALLLGVLAFFDYLATPPEEPETPVFSRPVPVGPKKDISQPVTPATNLPEPPPSPVAEPTPAPVAEPPPPVVAPSPAPVEESKAPPSESRAARKPEGRAGRTPEVPTESRPPSRSTATAPHAPAPSAPARPAEPVTSFESTTSPAMAPIRKVPESAPPSARVIQVQPAPVIPPHIQRLFSGFLLQAGVFSSPQRAEELHAKLTLSGVPSTLETRVQVGPFRTRQEAEAAQDKLRELGVETVLVPPKGAKH